MAMVVAGPAVPADRGHRRAGHRLLQPRPARMGGQGKVRLREDPAAGGATATCPIGFKGLILAGLLASFMSTFVSTVNSGAAYVVNDIYKRYINPHAAAQAIRPAGLRLLHRRSSCWASRSASSTKSVHSDHRVDRLGADPGLRGPQRAQVALVAVQRLRLLRRHGRPGTLSALVLLFIGKADYMSSWTWPRSTCTRSTSCS